MLKRMFALSDQGSKDLNKGIAATTLSNICLIIPSSILIMVIWELLNIISGESAGISEYVPLFCIVTVVLFIIVFLTQWLQYNKTFPIYNRAAGGRGKYGRQKIEIRYHKPDLWFVRGPAYSCGFDLQETKITERG